MPSETFDVVVVGGGPVGLATAYEVAKTGARVIVLEKNNFFNHAGSSNDLARMFRTMYTEDSMADLAKESLGFWDILKKDSGTSLRWMTGLLNFGDKDFGENTAEGTLLGPIPNLERLGMAYTKLSAEEIENRYPFKNLAAEWIGLYAPDNGIINVQLLLRTLLSLAQHYGAQARQHTDVKRICPSESDSSIWEVHTIGQNTVPTIFKAKKIVIALGGYVNHLLEPSFGISLDLDIWEMVVSYFNCNAGPGGTLFPSMWFQFAPDKGGRSQLFYGFPALPWGPANVARIAVDAATRRIKDLNEENAVGVDSTVPFFTSSCLQTNVFDNMFVLDHIPEEYLGGGAKDSVVVFTAGWAMKFVPLLGKALTEMSLYGESQYALPEFSITRTDPNTSKGSIIDSTKLHEQTECSFAFTQQASGSSIKGSHNTGL
ncbi:hypothetical protein GGR55DRAFT_689257 [Xylaria sp. FL0064]|nr:hypothetical protein GGR55DRAFT_689257 [Xylaria sp. FL0064]